MMRNITRICFAMALAAFCVTSCHRELEITPAPEMPELEGDGIVLKLDVGGMEMNTRVDADTRPGDDDGAFNEKILGNAVDVFFFPEGATDNSRSTFSTSASVAASSTGGHLSIPVNAQRISTIFDGTVPGSKSLVYVVANYNGATSFDHENGSYTLGELKSLPLAKANWATFPQSRFVMTGSSEITLIDASKTTPASGSIQMRRVASKVTFKLTVADEIVVENIKKDQGGNVTERSLETWHPLKESMTVYLQYSMNYARLDGKPLHVPADPKSVAAKDSLFTFDPNKLVASTKTIARDRTIIDRILRPEESTSGEWEVESHHEVLNVPVYDTKVKDLSTDGPFYSYPVTWEPGVQTEPFLKLIIPWNNGSHTKYYYYKVPFSVSELESNNWYEVTLDVQILGGEDEQPIPLTATYKIVDWVPGTTSEASVVNARYLSVPKTEWIMYNTEELTIPITSSHDVEIVGYQVKSKGTAKGNAFAEKDKYDNNRNPLSDTWIGSDPRIYNPFTGTLTSTTEINATRPNYNDSDMDDGAPAPYNLDATSWFPTITTDQIVFKHDLNNDMTSKGSDNKANYDVAPYYIRFQVRHKDNPAYFKDIIIEQRPAIVIEPQQNSATNRNQHGFVWIDKSYNSSTTWKAYTNALDGSNHNVNMYVISTSVLPSTSTSVLGDPRSLTAKSDGELVYGWDSTDGNYVGGGDRNRDLTYYYQTDVTSEAENTIAPSFRIASSHGQTSTMSYNDALRRCASYQEDGRPAGRWRIPTKAEILYITTLSADGMIPALFTFNYQQLDESYWCSNGKVDGVWGTPTYFPGTNGDRYVRCVYDEWFWENTTYATVDRNTFKWGDQTRESVVRTKAAE